MYTPDEREALRNYYLGRGEVFLGPIDHDHVNQVILDLIKHAGANEVKLAISSPGGHTDAGFRLAQFIEQEFPVPVDARVWGACNSAATYALLSCRSRTAHPESTFVLHRQTAGIETEYNLDYERKVDEWKRDNAQLHKRQVAFYTRKLKISKKAVEKELLRGTGIDAEISVKKALRIGLITGISTF
ncbi:ATP-dependent Clp protease proteolytic subunit [Candidatus Kaiserbacteria bacterium]|nr:ATP-dependent Clp protease proteolytic subunit [Candidatus Kaiserbacteria bacterium]